MTSFNFDNEHLADARRFLRTNKSRIAGPAAIVLLGLGGQMATHVVQRGDTLYSLAKEQGVTVEEIATANNISNPNLIVAGQKLSLPASNDITVVVQPGETVWSIAQAHGVTVASIIDRNGLGASARIIEGQKLRIGAQSGSADAQPEKTWAEKKAAREARKAEQEAAAAAKAEAEAEAEAKAKAKAEAKAEKQAEKDRAAEEEAENEQAEQEQAEEVPAEEAPEPEVAPEPEPEPEKNDAGSPGVVTTIYVVQQGDSVASIASLFGIEAQVLADANGISVDAALDTGSRLNIPSR